MDDIDIARDFAVRTWAGMYRIVREDDGVFRVTLLAVNGPVHFVKVHDGAALVWCHSSHVGCHIPPK
jgi:hypothetical protein